MALNIHKSPRLLLEENNAGRDDGSDCVVQQVYRDSHSSVYKRLFQLKQWYGLVARTSVMPLLWPRSSVVNGLGKDKEKQVERFTQNSIRRSESPHKGRRL